MLEQKKSTDGGRLTYYILHYWGDTVRHKNKQKQYYVWRVSPKMLSILSQYQKKRKKRNMDFEASKNLLRAIPVLVLDHKN